MSLLLIVLLGLMIVAAAIALGVRDRMSGIVALGAVGFLVAVAFLLLGAPDVAKTQILVEIVSLVLLLRVTAGKERTDAIELSAPEGTRPAIGVWAVALTVTLLSAGVGAFAFASYPALGEPVMARLADSPSPFYLAHALSDTGAANVVSAILLDFRAYDTLGEATVLFCAVIGALVVLRRDAPAEADRGPKE